MAGGELDSALAAAVAQLPGGWRLGWLANNPEEPPERRWQAVAQHEGGLGYAQGFGVTADAALIEAVTVAAGRTQESVEEEEPRQHATVPVLLPDGPEQIDVEIAPLVAAVAMVGLRTVTSCQRGYDGRAYLEFESVEDATGFLEIAVDEFSTDVESVWNRAMRDHEPEVEWDAFRHDRMWSYGATPSDFSVAFRDPDADDNTLVRVGPPEIGFRLIVSFPPSDIPYLVDRMRRHSDLAASGDLQPSL